MSEDAEFHSNSSDELVGPCPESADTRSGRGASDYWAIRRSYELIDQSMRLLADSHRLVSPLRQGGTRGQRTPPQ